MAHSPQTRHCGNGLRPDGGRVWEPACAGVITAGALHRCNGPAGGSLLVVPHRVVIGGYQSLRLSGGERGPLSVRWRGYGWAGEAPCGGGRAVRQTGVEIKPEFAAIDTGGPLYEVNKRLSEFLHSIARPIPANLASKYTRQQQGVFCIGGRCSGHLVGDRFKFRSRAAVAAWMAAVALSTSMSMRRSFRSDVERIVTNQRGVNAKNTA